MKKTFAFFLVAGVIVFVSCASGPSEAEKAAEQKRVADSIAMVEKAKAEEEARIAAEEEAARLAAEEEAARLAAEEAAKAKPKTAPKTQPKEEPKPESPKGRRG